MAEYKRLDSEQNVPSLTPTTTTIMSESGNTFEDFKSFEMLVSFNRTKLWYTPTETIWAYFYSKQSLYQMKDDDQIGICLMNDTKLLKSKKVSECEIDIEIENMDADDFCLDDDDEKIIARKTSFLADFKSPSVSEPVYYQFCYLSVDGKIVGKSTPFQINIKNDRNEMNTSKIPLTVENPVNDEIINDRQEEDDFIVVRSQESFLKERIEHLTKSNNLLQYLIRTMEKDLSTKNNEVNELKAELDDYKDKVATLDKNQKDVLQELELANLKKINLEEEKEKFQSFIKTEKNQRNALEKEIESYKDLNLTLNDKLQDALKSLAIAQQQLLEKDEEISKYKKLYDDVQNLNFQLNDDLLKSAETIKNLEASLDQEKKVNRKLYMDDLNAMKQDTLSKTAHLEKLVMQLESELKSHDKLAKELKDSSSNLKEQLKSAQQTIDSQKQKIQQLILTNDKLNVDYIGMRARLEQAKVEYGNLFTKCKSYKRKLARYQLIQSDDKGKNLTMNDSQVSQISSNIDLMDQISNNSNSNSNDWWKLPSAPTESLINEPEITPANPTNNEVNSSPAKVVEEFFTNTNTINQQLNTAVKTLAISDDAENSNQQRQSTNSGNIQTENTIAMPCTMCDKTIECRQHLDGTGQLKEMIEHFELVHMQKMCPVCSVLFDTRLPIFKTYFSSHVENHLSQMKYPK